MTAKNLFKPAILTMLLSLVAISSWEIYLRYQKIPITYDDSAELWADKRKRVYIDKNKATVFIGSSRIKYDLDIKTWEKTTGKEAIQLAIEGTCPLSILEDLGNDTEFKGQLIIDVTEVLYYNLSPAFNKIPESYIQYFHKQTYAQKAGFEINHLLESKFVFFNKKFLSLSAQLDNLPVSNRAGVPLAPKFPMDFINVDFDRQTKMGEKFLTDKVLQKEVTNTWMMLLGMIRNSPPPKDNPIPIVLQKSKDAIDKIRSRGGEVLFIRTPSSGPYFELEQAVFKREIFWEPLLAATVSKGIYFTDYPSISKYNCIEWSHLTPEQAIDFTAEFIKITSLH
ncbi:hypothetical protein GKZ90_0006375 [Flavobacterium sp. MC2016-06]|jgi:hypothetical protein|uniref:hypothetical protein n=1 Tax=Flavobacterium sp. MC2016-06 TaxID=2676308 RepID=UPI0012BAFA02|nr:hypothetical protein [Flavobacterium sp. MC2016-06]MBU3857764.1 hypothetical protein [Flavobacterium sp. MC2016-06]